MHYAIVTHLLFCWNCFSLYKGIARQSDCRYKKLRYFQVLLDKRACLFFFPPKFCGHTLLWKMKIPHPLSNAWTRTTNEDLVPIAMPGNHKKFKRKSQEPKKMKMCADDMFDADAIAAVQSDECKSSDSAPLTHRQMAASQDAMAGGSELLSGLTEETAGAQSSAIDMTIGIKVPAVPSKLPHLPRSPSFNHHHHLHTSWPQTISQPLSNNFPHGLCPTLSPTTSTSSRQSQACRNLAFSLQPSASGQTAPLHGTSTFNPSKHLEPQLQLPKVIMKTYYSNVLVL